MARASRAQGVHGDGGRGYTPKQAADVAYLLATAEGEVTTVAELADRTGINGRTVRQIISDYDGIRFLLGGDGNGYRLATSRLDAARITARLRSQQRQMLARVERRERYARENLAEDSAGDEFSKLP